MGSSNSRLGSRPSRPRVNGTNKRSILSSLICGGSSSRAIYEMEDHPSECLVKSAEHHAPQISEVHNASVGPFFSPSTGTASTSQQAETGATSERIISSIKDYSIEGDPSSIGTSSSRPCLSECKELVSPNQVSADYSCDESCMDNSSTTSFSQEQQSSDLVSVNVSANTNAVHGIDSSMHSGASQTCFEVTHPSSSSFQGFGTTTRGLPIENYRDEDTTALNSDSDTNALRVANLPLTSHSLGNESLEEAGPSGLGFLVTNRERGRADGGILHMDVVSISSNYLYNSFSDGSNREARRNSRRLFWDAFSRRSSRRLLDSPTIAFSTDDPEELRSHERWLLGLSGDLFEDGSGADSGFFSGRIASMNERRRRSRSEIWDRLRGGGDENSRRNNFCPSGLHPDGACSCESFLLSEEFTTRASISRIVMLAEALFEVLDEIHRQPVPLSLSMVSSPAPASMVDSFPLKSHTKADMPKGVDGIIECYICLAEYEEGDKIRVLPCHHEYHMSCVDKWLKEIHGVCPLCRGDVCEGFKECSESNS